MVVEFYGRAPGPPSVVVARPAPPVRPASSLAPARRSVGVVDLPGVVAAG
ncbi:hypothetical protein AB0283_04925 [Micromonospora vinacea]